MNRAAPTHSATAASQSQFLEVIDRDTAEERFRAHLDLRPVGTESVPLDQALGRTLAEPVAAGIDVPGFDRANVDGFAVRAADTVGAMEESPVVLRLNGETIEPGSVPGGSVAPGTATPIATGATLPRGADAVVMVERTDVAPDGGTVEVAAAASPGQFVAFAGTDMGLGETVLRRGQAITSREAGVLAAIGHTRATVFRRPRVAILSTGNEIVAPGDPLPAGCVYDANGPVLAAAVAEAGGEPLGRGIVPDEETRLAEALDRALAEADAILLSGGTSKGAGDLSYRVVSRLADPGIVAHGVALKPGKPICLAVTAGKPVVILPGFPTSAIFTFHDLVAPVLRAFAGARESARESAPARLPVRVHSERGRREYLLVSLVRGESELAAYPMGKGSGSVTAFTYADGFITIPRHTEQLEADSPVTVQLLGEDLAVADLVAIGSHCTGLDHLLGALQERGLATKALHVGSTGGLTAARRGECDIAGIHLLDPESGEYNRPFLGDDLELIPGYRRMQGLLFRPEDPRFAVDSPEEAIAAAVADPDCFMVNRNPGSGTRILTDRLLEGRQPPGYWVQTKSHNAVAAAVAQGRADWGLAIGTVARDYGLGFLPVQEEHYDFVTPRARARREPVARFRELLAEPATRAAIRGLGFRLPEDE